MSQQLTELEQSLIETRAQLWTYEHLRRRLDNLRQALQAERSRFSELSALLHKEQRAVERLEGMSLKLLLHTILGNDDEQLEKERQEYAAVKLRYDQCRHALETMETEIEELSAQVTAQAHVPTQYQLLLDAKQQVILEAGDIYTEQLVHMMEYIAEGRTRLRELDEAAAAGQLVLDGLAEVVKWLKNAADWGHLDMVGIPLATFGKHSHLDSARAAVHKTQQRLQHFHSELRDVRQSLRGNMVNLDGADKFADYFFDGLMMDLVIQERIDHGRKQAIAMRNRVESLLEALERERCETARRVGYWETEKQRFVEQK